MRKKNTPLVYALLIVGVFGFLLFKAVENRARVASNTDPQTGNHGAVTQRAGTSVTQASSQAPDFTLRTLDGGSITLSSFEGEKPVILDFWASWCHNCQRAMPRLSKIYEDYSDRVEIIGVNLRERDSAVQRFIDSRGIAYPIAMDPGHVASQYAIRYTNTHILIDKQGNIVRVVPGDVTERDVRQLIEG